MRLNVIIPSYRSAATIGETLDSLRLGTSSHSFEYDITVVDSTEDESVGKIVKSKDFEVKFLHLDERAFPGKARNIGVMSTKGDIVCFIDADARAGDGWLQNIYRYFEANPGVAVVGGP